MEWQLSFVGLGLNGMQSLSNEALQVLEEADKIFIESYTNFLEPNLRDNLVSQFKKPIKLLLREDLEQDEDAFLSLCKSTRIALLVPGDPFIATTHVALRLSAIRKSIQVHVVHAPSILSVAPAITGLSAYRFGKTATVAFQRSKYCYDILSANRQISAHTLLLLDIDVASGRFLDINTAIDQLRGLEGEYEENIFTENLLLFGLSRLGTKKAVVRVGNPAHISKLDWKTAGPPQSLIVCSELQAYEEESIQVLWGKQISR
ncbi:MAG: diphthine synthase [Candidatus Thorarchaeota archaeon]